MTDGHRLRHQLADHDVKEREGDDRHHEGDVVGRPKNQHPEFHRLGNPHFPEQRGDHGEHKRLPEETQRERGNRDSQLVRGQETVELSGHPLGVMRGARLLFLVGLELARAYLHDRELGSHEKRVQEQEEDDPENVEGTLGQRRELVGNRIGRRGDQQCIKKGAHRRLTASRKRPCRASRAR